MTNQIIGCTAIGNRRDGIRILAGHDYFLYNNLLRGNGGHGLNVVNSSVSDSNLEFSSFLELEGLPSDFDFPNWMRRNGLPKNTNPIALAELVNKLRESPEGERIFLILHSHLMLSMVGPKLDIPFVVDFLLKKALISTL